jgi:serine/threonine protein kinase
VGNLPERAVALIAYEVLKIVDACHEAHILHGDIKVGRHRALGAGTGCA